MHLEEILALLKPPDGVRRPSPDAAHRAAEEHVGSCSDCWSILELLFTATGQASPEALPLQAFDECEDVQGSLYLFVGLSPQKMQADYPIATRHLRWCLSCRERFATLLLIERDLLQRHPAPVAADPLGDPSPWRSTARTSRSTVRDLLAPLVVGVGPRLAAFIRLPNGVLTAGLPRLLEPARGDRVDEAHLDVARTILLPLGASGLTARITVDPHASGRVSLEVSLDGAGERSGTIALRTDGDESGELLALTAISSSRPARLAGVPQGKYMLEIGLDAATERYRTSLEIEAMPSR